MKEITEQEILKLQSEGKKILLDLYATWCGPCKFLIPRLEKLSESYPDAVFVKMDVDKNTDFAVNMGIRSVPTVMIFDGNNLVNRSSGVQPDTYYTEFLK